MDESRLSRNLFADGLSSGGELTAGPVGVFPEATCASSSVVGIGYGEIMNRR